MLCISGICWMLLCKSAIYSPRFYDEAIIPTAENNLETQTPPCGYLSDAGDLHFTSCPLLFASCPISSANGSAPPAAIGGHSGSP